MRTIIVLVSWLLTLSRRLTIFLRMPELFWKSALYLGLLTTFSAVTNIEFKKEESSCWTPCSPSSSFSSAALEWTSDLLLDDFLNDLHEFLEVLEDMLEIFGGHATELEFQILEKFDQFLRFDCVASEDEWGLTLGLRPWCNSARASWAWKQLWAFWIFLGIKTLYNSLRPSSY